MTTRDEVIVAIDLGTSACKVAAFDRKGKRIAYGRSSYSNLLDATGRAEQNPATWWAALKTAINASGIRNCRNHVLGYSVSTLRAAVLPVDSRGRSLTPAILASDTRATTEVTFLSELLGKQFLHHATGLRLSTYSSLARILWLRNYNTEIFSRTAWILCAQDYLISKLCGRLITDRSHASRTLCLNIWTRQWDCKILESSGLSSELFPALVDAGTVVDELSPKASRTLEIPVAPVIAAGGDQMCASVGLGAVTPEQISINHGTGSFIERPTSAPTQNSNGKNLASVHILPNYWVQEFPILLTGRLLEDFIRTTLGSRADFRKLVESALRQFAKSNQRTPLLFLPYQAGSTAPHWNDDLPGVLWGLRSCHHTSDLLRSLLESIVFDLRRCMLALPTRPQEVSTGGQLTHLKEFNQMQADIFGIPVTRAMETEATALGAAVVGFVALGLYPSFQVAVQEMVHFDESCRQLPREDMQSYYQALFDLHSKTLDLIITHAKG